MEEVKRHIQAILEAIRTMPDVVDVQVVDGIMEDMYEVKAWVRFQGCAEDVVLYLL